MKVYNTLTNQKEEFVPLSKNMVKMYVCGPTVYDFIHIGNARPFVVFDTVRRYLEYKGYSVCYVQNFTDIDDKIINKAIASNVTMSDISEKYIEEALKDINSLNIKPATFTPKVTEEIEEIINMISGLIENGSAYEKEGTVFFNTKNFKEYGKLSGKNLDELEFGARIKLDEKKENPTDFVLWKPKKEGEPFWPSPWSEGRPGWHIECSAMAKKYLGEEIDIHAGGEDLIFPHHENEIAQSESCNHKKFAKYWLHNGFINIENEKMSKSKGNFFTIREISEKIPYDVIRFFILNVQYRNPINFSEDLMNASKNGLDRIKNCIKNLKYSIENSNLEPINEEEKQDLIKCEKFKQQFEKAMEDDFNTADAIAAIFDFVKFINLKDSEKASKEFLKELLKRLENLLNVLGVLFEVEKDLEISAKEVDALIEERQKARADKNYKLADELRDKLKDKGIILEDTSNGVRWSRQ